MYKEKKYSITIIWWTSGFWKWLALFLLRKFSSEIEITITWTNEQNTKKVASELICKYSTDNINAAKDADIVIFSVPIWLTEEIIRTVWPHIKSWSLVMDVTSIKNTPSKAMIESVNKDVLVIPTHPMFGPFISTIAWQIIILTPDYKTKKNNRYKILKSFLENENAKVFEVSPVEHDKMMAIIQWLTHYNMFILWETIKRLKVDIKQSFDFVSPIYKILISSIGRYANQNPKLYSDIQMSNPEILDIHKVFIDSANDYSSYIKNKDEKQFIDSLEETKEFFWDNADYWQKYTDKIIFMISRQIEKIENNIWNKITMLNIYSKEKIGWVLKEYRDEICILDNGEKYDINEWEVL